MATITFDGQSFSIDGHRIWLVSGAIHYARTPRQLWRQRIRAAREAGLNCIETYCFWNAHEAQPGTFDFAGDLDLRRFVMTCAEEGLYVIVRPGPYICAEWDFGGLPPWLHREMADPGPHGTLRVREADPVYQAACERYYAAIMGQVRDLQITEPGEPEHPGAAGGNAFGAVAGGYRGGGGGPILMMQAENEWFCHNDEQQARYLDPFVRYLRDNGCTVPINNCNNLWQPITGSINTWNGARKLTTDMRQLAIAQPDVPKFVTEYWPGWFDMWGAKHSTVDPDLNLYRMAGILAGGAQYNLYMFHGGTNFAFWGGRTVASPGCFMTTSYDYDAPLLEAGGRGRKYELTKRLSTFASQFGNVFANLRPGVAPVTVAPTEEDHPLAVFHLPGTAGDVVLLLRSATDAARETQVILPDGLHLTVPLGEERVAWLLLNVNLNGAATLDYTNLRPWAFLDNRVLVLFGPAGSEGIVSLDGVRKTLRVPTGDEPAVEKHKNLTLVVLSTGQTDHAYLFANGIALHSAGLDDKGKPKPRAGAKALVLADRKGKIRRPAAAGRPNPRKPVAPRLGAWQLASLSSLIDGTDDRYRPIDGPASLELLGQDYGYGWYRLAGVPIGASSAPIFAPQAADRVHVYARGKLQTVLGFAPGAEPKPVACTLADTTVLLADNLGRYNYGLCMGEKKGLFGHLYHVRAVRLPKPKRVAERAADPFQFGGYAHGLRRDEALPVTESLIWTIQPSRGRPMILSIDGLSARGTWLLNGKPLVLYLDATSGKWARYVFTPGQDGFTRGRNELKFSPLDPIGSDVKLGDHLTLYQATGVPTADAEWSFCGWQVPERGAFGPLPRKLPPRRPAWFRCEFTVGSAEVPLWFEPRGLSKGQLYLNGRNIGRYFVATADGKPVPPQGLYYLPEPWLKTGARNGANELLVFDEHGLNPSRSRLVYNAMGPYAEG